MQKTRIFLVILSIMVMSTLQACITPRSAPVGNSANLYSGAIGVTLPVTPSPTLVEILRTPVYVVKTPVPQPTSTISVPDHYAEDLDKALEIANLAVGDSRFFDRKEKLELYSILKNLQKISPTSLSKELTVAYEGILIGIELMDTGYLLRGINALKKIRNNLK